MQAAVRFWSKVAQAGNVCECWDWTAAKLSNGYGVFGARTGSRLAHRISYEMTRGAVPAGLELDHLCRNRACVNPWHLEPVTHRENQIRGSAGHRMAELQRNKTHCPRGHGYTAENTYLNRSSNGRTCRTCQREAQTKYKAKKLEAMQ